MIILRIILKTKLQVDVSTKRKNYREVALTVWVAGAAKC
jgi:hypothetical protein